MQTVMYRSQEKNLDLVTVSIIVPISNMKGQLSNLRSWINKADSSIQIVLVHDFKDVETRMEILDLLKENEAPSVVLLEGEYGGPGQARNAGLNFAIGRWICFWDSDDLGDIRALSNLVSTQANVGYDLIVFRYKKINTKGNQLVCTSRSWGKGEINNLIHWGSHPGIWRCLFSADFINGLQFPEILMGEDQVYLARVSSMGPHIYFSSEIIYSYFVGREGQLTNGNYDDRDILIAQTKVGLELQNNHGGKQLLSKVIWCGLTMTILKKQRWDRSPQLLFHLALVLIKDPRLFMIFPKKWKVMC